MINHVSRWLILFLDDWALPLWWLSIIFVMSYVSGCHKCHKMLQNVTKCYMMLHNVTKMSQMFHCFRNFIDVYWYFPRTCMTISFIVVDLIVTLDCKLFIWPLWIFVWLKSELFVVLFNSMINRSIQIIVICCLTFKTLQFPV